MKIKKIIIVFFALLILTCSIPVYAYTEPLEINNYTFVSYVGNNNNVNFYLWIPNTYINSGMHYVTIISNSNDTSYTWSFRRENDIWVNTPVYYTTYSTAWRNPTSNASALPNYQITEDVELYNVVIVRSDTDYNNARNQYLNYLNGEDYSGIEIEEDTPDEYDGTNGEYGLSDDAPEDIKLALDGWQLIGQSMYNMDNRHAQFSLKLDGLDEMVDKVDVFLSKHGNVAETIWLSALHVLAFIPEPYQPLFASLVIAADTETAIMHAVTNDNDDIEEININLPEPYKTGDEYDINIRPVVTDLDTGKHYYGNWKTYTTIGDTIINNYQSTTINNVTYETSAQSQKQYEFNYQPPAAGGIVNDYPPVTNETNTTVNNIYNYYTIYNSETNTVDNSITNNYWSYPSTLDTNTPELDELLTELTPENFFTFLKKFLDSLLKFFTMIINFLELFIPAWVVVILKIAVTSALLLAIGLIIIKGVL